VENRLLREAGTCRDRPDAVGRTRGEDLCMTLALAPSVPGSRRRLAPAVNVAAKAALGVYLALVFAVPGLTVFRGQALQLRGLMYVLGIALVPCVWRLRRCQGRYPHLLDLCVIAPSLFDTAGNGFHLYGRVDNFDGAAHLVGWLCFSGAVALVLPAGLAPWNRACLVVGLGAVAGIGLELTEFTLFSRPVVIEATAYRDTLGDLAMDLAGASAAAVASLRRR
jgi:hypothetical protein